MKTPLTAKDVSRCTPQTIELADGLSIHIETTHDDCSDAPWENSDGHGPVSDWTTRDKRPGELILNTDRSSKRYYDFAEASRIAKRDGWGMADEAVAALARKLGRAPTAGEIRHAAVMHDFEFLRGWCADEWQYIVIAVTLNHDGREVSSDALGGVESFGDYWRQQAADMANALIEAHDKEQAEAQHWAERDSITL